MNIPVIGIETLSETAKAPTKATADAACYDVHACFHSEVVVYNRNNVMIKRRPDMQGMVLEPGDRALIPTGIIFHIPKGWSMRLHPRSGLALKQGLNLANGEGVVDSDYKLETFVILTNTSVEPVYIRESDRIAQIEAVPVQNMEFSNVKYATDSERTGGFGSTGT